MSIGLLIVALIAAGGYWFLVLRHRPLVSEFEEGLHSHKTHTEAKQYFKEQDLLRISVSAARGGPFEIADVAERKRFIWLNDYKELPEQYRLQGYAAFADVYDAAAGNWPATIDVLIDSESDHIIGYLVVEPDDVLE
ncbi:MAG: hypothetical protein ACYTDT_12820 [Planctomycetota bacterium]|jgi:hypothetical protein